ncbi:MAG: ribonuclease BN [Bacteroidetes bacterium GWF2_33_16]|nr:MAG: ribonuclease BN [Bacteroidetes bacterium GWE2_32_14]OFY02955.1 MAG: ribonuclease BN [Bacteroidetes bacterium GWF2_33_16]
MKFIHFLIKFLQEDVWRIPLKNMPRYKLFFLRQLRIIILSIRGLSEDKVSLRASALTFYSMLSVVPVAAMGFGIAKGFGFEKYLQEQLTKNFSEQKEVLEWIITFANKFLENTSGGIIAGIGIAMLLWSVMKVLGNIENSFNAIWQIRSSRSWSRKFTDYLSMMLIAPILLLLSSSATVFISTQVQQITAEVALLGKISPIIFFLVQSIPYVLIWLLLTVIYMVMPNTKVNIIPAFTAGVIAGTAFVIVQWAYIRFQIGVSQYNAIYGSFAALPFFLIWLQTSWLIVLFGAEVSFSVQNVEKYEFDPDILNISAYSKKVITLMILHLLIKNFIKGEKPLISEEISKKLEIPIRIVRDALFILVETNILSEVTTRFDKQHAYQPARDINQISVSFVLNALDHYGTNRIIAATSVEQNQFKKLFAEFDVAINKSKGSMLVKDIDSIDN